MTLMFEGCPSYTLQWLKSCGEDVIRIILFNLYLIAPMYGLLITDANSILERPIIYKEGELKEDHKVIPTNMNHIYMKI
jgi:hypothetical protein